jgi:protease-4
VAESREMSTEEVNEVAQGRVWTGSQAKQRGLIDQTGTLQQAIDAAARIAGLGSNYYAVYDEWELSAIEAFLFEMTSSAMAYFNLGISNLGGLNNTLLENIISDLKVLSRSNDGLTIAAYCLCDVE